MEVLTEVFGVVVTVVVVVWWKAVAAAAGQVMKALGTWHDGERGQRERQ